MKLTAVLLALNALAPLSAQTTETEATKHKEDQQIIPKSDHTFTGNLNLASQYVFRGLSQTDGKPALQGGFDYSHANGLYLGTWLSNISWYTDQNAGVASAPVALASPGSVGAPYVLGKQNSANLEWDLYAGFKKSFANDWSLDVGAVVYYYPGIYANTGAYRQPHTTEVYGQLGYAWMSLKYSRVMGGHFFGVHESGGTGYVDLSSTIPLRDSGYKFLAHLGHQRYPRRANTGYWGASGGDNSFFSYTDYKLGVTKDLGNFVLGAAWTYADTKHAAPDGETTAYMNAFGKNIGRDRITLTLTRNF